MSLEEKITLLTDSIGVLTASIQEANRLATEAVVFRTANEVELKPAIMTKEHAEADVTPDADAEGANATPTPPPPTKTVDPEPEQVKQVDGSDDIVATDFASLPDHHKRPFPAMQKKPRNSRPEITLNKLLEARDSTPAEIQEAKNAVYDYMIKRAERSMRRLNNVETSTVKEANDLATALKYEEIERDHYVALADGATGLPDVDKGAQPEQVTETTGEAIAPPPTASAPTPPPAEEKVVDTTRGAPSGYTLTDSAPDDLTYSSYMDSGWTNQQLLDNGYMVEVAAEVITIDGLRETMMELSHTKPSDSLAACVGKYALELEQVKEEDYPSLLNDLHSVADA